MADIIDDLYRDHVKLRQLLAAMERQIELFEKGEHPDYELIQAVVDYCLTYPDVCHHPKEDAVYRHLAQVPGWQRPLHDLEAEHAALATLTHRVAETIERVLKEEQMTREAVITAAREFLERYHHHIDMEDEYFLPQARDLLSAEDLAEAEAEVEEAEDPLTQGRVEARFARLAREILEWDADARRGAGA